MLNRDDAGKYPWYTLLLPLFHSSVRSVARTHLLAGPICSPKLHFVYLSPCVTVCKQTKTHVIFLIINIAFAFLVQVPCPWWDCSWWVVRKAWAVGKLREYESLCFFGERTQPHQHRVLVRENLEPNRKSPFHRISSRCTTFQAAHTTSWRWGTLAYTHFFFLPVTQTLEEKGTNYTSLLPEQSHTTFFSSYCSSHTHTPCSKHRLCKSQKINFGRKDWK